MKKREMGFGVIFAHHYGFDGFERGKKKEKSEQETEKRAFFLLLVFYNFLNFLSLSLAFASLRVFISFGD